MKLSDTQRIVLSHGAQHPQLLAIAPKHLPVAACRAVVNSLIKSRLLIEVAAPRDQLAMVWRKDADGTPILIQVTDEGLRAIGIEPNEGRTAPDTAPQYGEDNAPQAEEQPSAEAAQAAPDAPNMGSVNLSEQDTKRILITPTIEALGWDILDIDEVRNEYRHNSADNPVDYALFVNRSPVLFVEAKPLGHSLDDRRWIVQTVNYANAAGVDWCVLANGAEWRIYKVHAQVEADRKLFKTVEIETSEALNDAGRVLRLLSRDNMRARAIDELWQAWHVDGQVRAALENILQDDAFAALIRRRVPQLSVSDIRKSLRRASLGVSYPDIFLDISAAASSAPPPQSATPSPGSNDTLPPAVAGPPVDDDSTANMPRRRLQSTQDLFELGRLKAGDTLTIRGRDNSMARVIDGRHVDFRGQRVTFNDWGQRVTGWPSIRIYTMACLPDGRTLDQLRDDPAEPTQTS